MKNLLLIVILAVTLTGCCKGHISVLAVKPSMDRVLERHDKYIESDTTLTPQQRTVRLRTSELVGKVLEEASK